MKPAAFDHAAPDGIGAALALLSGEGARPVSGGQSLAPVLNLRLLRPSLLVDVKALPGLRGAREEAGRVVLGAATTHAEIEDGAVPDPSNGLMRRVARGIAHRAVRNRGTLGGSLAHADPAADWPCVMLALGATMLLLGPTGERRVPAAGFVLAPFVTALAPGEILRAVEIPRLPPGARWGHCKINRRTGEFARAMAVCVSEPRRVALGALEAPPRLLGPGEEAPEDLPARLPWLEPARSRLHAVALRRALAEMEAA